MTYVQRGDAWADKGRTRLLLPSVDLPIARTGVTVYHSPRFSLVPEPGAFRVNTDSGPFTETLRAGPAGSAGEPSASPSPLSPRPPASGDVDLIEQYRKDVAGRSIAGPLPVTVPFPEFGTSVFLTSELTAELQGPALEFSYKRESRW